MPDLEAVASGGDGGERGETVGGGFGEVGRGEDDDVGGHPVVDVAAKGDDTWLVEEERIVGFAFVERKLEGFGFREGVDVVLDGVAIREAHAGAGDDRGDVRREFFVDLRDDDGIGRRRERGRRGGVERGEGGDGVGDGLVFGIGDFDADIGASERRCGHDQSEEDGEGFNHGWARIHTDGDEETREINESGKGGRGLEAMEEGEGDEVLAVVDADAVGGVDALEAERERGVAAEGGGKLEPEKIRVTGNPIRNPAGSVEVRGEAGDAAIVVEDGGAKITGEGAGPGGTGGVGGEIAGEAGGAGGELPAGVDVPGELGGKLAVGDVEGGVTGGVARPVGVERGAEGGGEAF